jgi:hypothetical protein
MPARQIHIDSNMPIELNIVSKSPHVVAYRIWTRTPPAVAWTQAADGDTQDNIPDDAQLSALPSGTSLTYWFGIGGNPGTFYRALLLISQSGKVLDDATLIEEGTTDANGFAVVEKEVSFA